jgi:hypothetical protein
MRESRLSLQGQSDMRLGPVEKYDSQVAFYPLEGSAQGRLGHVQDRCCATEVALLVEHLNDQKLLFGTHLTTALSRYAQTAS